MSWMTADHEAGLVSVIIPTYNRAGLIGEAIESVRAQTYRPIEIIIADDGSTDDTEAVVGRFAESAGEGLNVRYVRQENQGAPAARNRGLLESRGEFIQFLDSDDLLHPDKLSAQVTAMRQEPEADYVFSGWEQVDGKGKPAGRRWPEDFSADRETILDLTLRRDTRRSFPFCTINGLYRRSLCRRLGPWDTEQKRMQDFLYNVRMFTLPASYRHVPAVHAWARQHPGEQIKDHFDEPEQLVNMRSTLRKIRGVLEDAGLLGPTQCSLLGNAYWGMARSAFMSGARELGMELLEEGIALAPVSTPWLKLRTTRLVYRLLGTSGGNRLFTLAKWLARRGSR